MKTEILTALTFFGILLLLSCEKDVVFDSDAPAKLCLNCILNPDSSLSARLTLSRSIENKSTFQPIDDATILIFENGKEINPLISKGGGNYYLEYCPIPDNVYKITIQHPEYGKLSASAVVQKKPAVSFSCDTLGRIEQTSLYRVNVNFIIHDLLGKNNYWLYGKRTVHGVTYTGGNYSIQAPFIDDFNRKSEADSKYGFVYNDYVRITDTGYDGKNISFALETTTNETVNFVSVDEHYDKYIKSSVKARLNSEGELPFKEPVQIYTNIENGYGIFGSCAITIIKL